MKYVIFKYKTIYIPVIVPEHCTHSQIKIEGAEPISAGYFKVDSGVLVETYSWSESLNLYPHKRDATLLSAVIMRLSSSCFLTEEL